MPITAVSAGSFKQDYLPTKLVEDGMISSTSEAYNCFVGQQFSGRLQAFLVSYVISTTNAYATYK